MKTQEVIQLPSVNLRAKPEYTLYRNKINPKYKIQGRDNYFVFINQYFSTLAECIVNYSGGVYMKNFIYLFMFQIPEKKKVRVGIKYIYNFHSDHKAYTVSAMLPIKYRQWGFKRKSLSIKHRKKLKESIVMGNKYKAFFNTLREGKFV